DSGQSWTESAAFAPADQSDSGQSWTESASHEARPASAWRTADNDLPPWLADLKSFDQAISSGQIPAATPAPPAPAGPTRLSDAWVRRPRTPRDRRTGPPRPGPNAPAQRAAPRYPTPGGPAATEAEPTEAETTHAEPTDAQPTEAAPSDPGPVHSSYAPSG